MGLCCVNDRATADGHDGSRRGLNGAAPPWSIALRLDVGVVGGIGAEHADLCGDFETRGGVGVGQADVGSSVSRVRTRDG